MRTSTQGHTSLGCFFFARLCKKSAVHLPKMLHQILGVCPNRHEIWRKSVPCANLEKWYGKTEFRAQVPRSGTKNPGSVHKSREVVRNLEDCCYMPFKKREVVRKVLLTCRKRLRRTVKLEMKVELFSCIKQNIRKVAGVLE